jgi:PAS domain S-box-containing protein
MLISFHDANRCFSAEKPTAFGQLAYHCHIWDCRYQGYPYFLLIPLFSIRILLRIFKEVVSAIKHPEEMALNQSTTRFLKGETILAQKAVEKGGSQRSHILAAVQGIQDILDAIPFHVLLVDSAHQIVAVNHAVKQDFGLSPESVVGAYCPLVVHDRSIPIEECPLSEAIEKGGALEREIFDSRYAQWLSLAVYPTPIVTSDGRPVYLHFARDITQARNNAENHFTKPGTPQCFMLSPAKPAVPPK